MFANNKISRTRIHWVYFFAVVFILIASALSAFLALQDFREATRTAETTGSWIAVQASHEFKQFENSILRKAAISSDEDILLRFEVLLSRLDLILVGSESKPLRAVPGVVDEVSGIIEFLQEKEKDFRSIQKGNYDQYASIISSLKPFGKYLSELQRKALIDVQPYILQQELQGKHKKTTLTFIFLGVSSVLIIAFLVLEIHRREQIEVELDTTLKGLEGRVTERTRELTHQLTERKIAEDSLRELNETLELRVDKRTVDLQKQKEKAEAANRSKTEFLNTMSHELRTPLNAIIGFSDMIRRQVYSPIAEPRYIEYSEDIYASGSHLLHLVNDILDIARMESVTPELREEEFDLQLLLAEAIKIIEGQYKRGDIQIVQVRKDQKHFIKADSLRLKQILLNLLSNAVKYTPDGGCVEVTVKTNKDRSTEIICRDTGIGIEAEHLSRIFEPFNAGGKPHLATSEGVGLGLSICKKLVIAHGGMIDIDSKIGEGTVVTIVFPPERSVTVP